MSTAAWKALAMVPDDLLFFRDGKPSSRGSDHYLRSLFPPHPSTLYGALRTRRLLDGDVELDGLGETTWSARLGKLGEELGPWGGFGSLALRGPWLVRDQAPLFPVPADLGVLLEPDPDKSGKEPRIAKVVRFRPVEASEGKARPSLDRLLVPFELDGPGWKPWQPPSPGVEPRPAQGWFLTAAGLAVWRSGGVPGRECFVPGSLLWEDEIRTGVGLRSDQRTGEPGLIYTFGFIRLLPGVALGFEVQGTGLAAEGRVRLGGEGRTALLQDGPPFPAGEPIASGTAESFCVTFLTPALAAAGGYPPGFAADHPVGELAGRSCRLIAAALPGSVTVGGWDLAKGRPKPLRRAVPAGSVFVFEPVDGLGVEEVVQDLDGTCLSDFPAEGLARQGFGLVAAGVSR